ncbi:hypothetical protein F5Y03DRAFT_401572 [Xylaria venustula]|nr:hypothetical protein F5Y03DRAFT_401572 [Xylaria venustula]
MSPTTGPIGIRRSVFNQNNLILDQHGPIQTAFDTPGLLTSLYFKPYAEMWTALAHGDRSTAMPEAVWGTTSERRRSSYNGCGMEMLGDMASVRMANIRCVPHAATSYESQYTAANNFQEMFARHRCSQGLPASTIAHGLVVGIGSVETNATTINTTTRNRIVKLNENESIRFLKPVFFGQPETTVDAPEP